ncbi:phage tail protein [Shewanella algae]|uniref:Phage Tail Collar Domain n=1 Tax=Shewanella algae TaxID=38313 RepID=A0A379ZG26_9GAMM|nr:tail fiber protein [Shewanella algae]AXQ14209.1 phage tail protein [Shewanella algae]MBO2584562.1 phage tail protein [Shewanella algae]MBO2609770.1 phage tail protein [Shewanella algae]MBO2626509.1 phage tail protein [Shewanella algae]MBO2634955.1 phage tail protein [Shewanella algae]
MADNFIGEIRMVGFNYAPPGWALCDGQTISIASNTALFSLLGTMYGGDGVSTFKLPDLRGRVPVSFGQSPGTSLYNQGQMLGAEGTNLTTAQLPAHNHAIDSNQINASVSPLASTGSGTTDEPGPNTVPAKIASGLNALEAYSTTANTSMQPSPVSLDGNTNTTGNSDTVDLRQPLTVVNFIIALQGIYPPRT